jgi:transcriptional regulator with XRE-family HTH domain
MRPRYEGCYAWPARHGGRHLKVVTLVERPIREAAESIDGRLQQNLRRLRREHGLTLDVLSRRAGVSRAMISKIERGTAIPTATVLGKLSAAFEIGLSQLVGDARPRHPVLLPQIEQAIYRDPESGLERRSLSPLFPDRSVDFVLNTLPARSRVAFPGHHHGVEEYLFVSRGELIVVTAGQCYPVSQGSTLFYPGHSVHEFRNDTDQEVEFFIVIDDTRSR